MSLTVSAVWTSISSRLLYKKVFEPVGAFGLRSLYLYVQKLVADEAIKVVWKALHLVVLKGDNWLLLLQWSGQFRACN